MFFSMAPTGNKVRVLASRDFGVSWASTRRFVGVKSPGSGLSFRIQGLSFQVWGLGVQIPGFGVQGSAETLNPKPQTLINLKP